MKMEKQKNANDKDIESNMEDSSQTSDNLQESNIQENTGFYYIKSAFSQLLERGYD